MKTHLKILLVLCLGLVSVQAQPGGRGGGMMGGGRGPQFSGAMAKLFGDNSAFSAAVEMQVEVNDQPMSMPGKLLFDNNKSRFEMDMTQMKSAMLPPSAAAQMKAMGMDKMVVISRPDKKISYMIYPGLEAYAEMPIQDPDATKSAEDFKIETTELGKETVEGHPTIKNKAVVTNDKGEKHEFILWNATDLKKFPVKVETTENGNKMVMTFKEVKLSKPDSGLFDPPAKFKHYDNMQTMIQEVIMKRMGDRGGGMGGPPPGGGQ